MSFLVGQRWNLKRIALEGRFVTISDSTDSAGNIKQRKWEWETRLWICTATKASDSLLFHFSSTPWPVWIYRTFNKHSTTISISAGVNQGSPGTDCALARRAEGNRCCGIQTASIDTGCWENSYWSDLSQPPWNISVASIWPPLPLTLCLQTRITTQGRSYQLHKSIRNVLFHFSAENHLTRHKCPSKHNSSGGTPFSLITESLFPTF